MPTPLLPFVEVNSPNTPTACVIWLHGLGADGHDFESIVPQLALPESLPIRFIFPHAPMRPVTINQGLVMRAWFDIKRLDSLDEEDEEGIRASQKAIEDLIQHVHTTTPLPKNRIFLAGFSQGGAIALQTALRYPTELGGVIALSCYLPLAHTLSQEASEANAHIPIFMAHGTLDSIIPLPLAEMSKEILIRQHPLEWHTYPMPHGVCSEEISAISHWLRNI